ncbi:MAG: thiamine biosynthesis protein ThiS [Desulfobulbaceae bacterium A2]|nr:MAG: thiamine biosynthesis protein ThiS [Desulfobulbaceae bacterium A2]
MRVICNGTNHELEEGCTVAELLVQLGLTAATVVVEHNGDILVPAHYAERRLAEGDRLELVRFVGGG